jgi:hypothetical protein
MMKKSDYFTLQNPTPGDCCFYPDEDENDGVGAALMLIAAFLGACWFGIGVAVGWMIWA